MTEQKTEVEILRDALKQITKLKLNDTKGITDFGIGQDRWFKFCDAQDTAKNALAEAEKARVKSKWKLVEFIIAMEEASLPMPVGFELIFPDGVELLKYNSGLTIAKKMVIQLETFNDSKAIEKLKQLLKD